MTQASSGVLAPMALNIQVIHDALHLPATEWMQKKMHGKEIASSSLTCQSFLGSTGRGFHANSVGGQGPALCQEKLARSRGYPVWNPALPYKLCFACTSRILSGPFSELMVRISKNAVVVEKASDPLSTLVANKNHGASSRGSVTPQTTRMTARAS